MVKAKNKIKVTALVSGKEKIFNSLASCSESTKIGRRILLKIKNGDYTNVVRGTKDILFKVEFIPDLVCTLTPAWDTSGEEVPTIQQEFYSHYSAIAFLSGGGKSKHASYYRKLNSQPLGVPCDTPIKDIFDREWIVVFYKKGEFVPQKATSSCA